MAGPPILPEPGIRQFSEAGQPDTATGAGIAAVGEGVTNLTATIAGKKLRDEATGQREEFLNLVKGLEGASLDPNDPVLRNAPGADDLISFDVDTVVSDARRRGPDQVNIEVQQMAGELANVKRGVDQGITPVRALEINVEAITRRYIDRFPGLSRQFQSIAQTALGTQNNLLASTLRTYDELARSAASTPSQEEAMLDVLADINPLVKIGSEPQRVRSIANTLTTMRNNERRDSLLSATELAEARGDVGIAGEVFATRMEIEISDAMANLESDLITALPAEFQEQGIMGIAASVSSLTDAQRIETVTFLERARANALGRLAQVGLDQTLNSSMTGVLAARSEQVAALYDSAIASANLGKLNEQLEFTTSIIQNTNLREFESVLGKDALMMKNIISLLPPGMGPHNRLFNDQAQQMLATKMANFSGLMSLDNVLLSTGQDPSTPENKEVIDVFNRANVASLRTILLQPDAPGVAEADASRMLKSMSLEFTTASPEAKLEMLNVIGTPEFGEFFQTADFDTRAAMQDLARQTAEYGSIMLKRLGEEAIKDIGEPLMVRQFGIQRVPGFRALKPGEKVLGPLTAGQIVNFTIDDKGLRVSAKTPAELEALGVDPSPENLFKVNRMVAVWNSRLIANINAYARSLGALDESGDRASYINLALGIANANVRTEE